MKYNKNFVNDSIIYSIFHEYCQMTSLENIKNEFFWMSKQEIEELISIATHYRNYWGTYDDVSKLCEVRDDFDEMTQNEHWVYIIEIVWSD